MTAFPSYFFEASGSPTSRNLPDRLSETVNVKDWGAVGDGVANDSSAINAAINYIFTASGVPRGRTLYFPAGTYFLGSPATPIDLAPIANLFCNLVIKGASKTATTIRGTYSTGNPPFGFYDFGSGGNGYWLPAGALMVSSQGQPGSINNRSLNANLIVTVRDMTIQNDSTAQWSCAVCVGPCSAWRFENVKFVGKSGLAVTSSFNMIIRGCSAVCTSPLPTADNTIANPITAVTPTFFWPVPSDGNWGIDNIIHPELAFRDHNIPAYQGSFGISCGQSLMTNCDATGFDIGFGIGGNASTLISNRASRCGIGFHHSHTPSAAGLSGGTGKMFSCIADRCTWGHYPVAGYEFKACMVSGTQGPADPAAIQGIVFSGGTATVTTTNNHNLPVGTSTLILMTSPVGWTPLGSGNEKVTCTRTGVKTFTYALGADPGSFSSASWNYPIQLGADVVGSTRRTSGPMILSATCSIASFRFGGTSEWSNVVMATEGPYGWISQATNEWPAWQFYHCGTTGSGNNPLIPTMVFTDLPPVPSAQGVAEGQQYWIIDGGTIGFGNTDGVRLTTNAGTAVGSSVLNFASVPASIAAGMLVIERTTGSAITGGTTVVSKTSTTITISPAVGPNPVLTNDDIVFKLAGSNKMGVRYNGAEWTRFA